MPIWQAISVIPKVDAVEIETGPKPRASIV